MSRLVVALLGAACVLAAYGREPGFAEFQTVQESLARVPPKMRAEWLRKRGYDDSRYTTYRKPESTGLRLVGKYGRGPSVEVTGRDTLVALTLGSEVALISFANPDSPVVLSEIQLNFLPMQSALYDTFLLTCGNGLEVWNISNPRQPVFRHVIPYGVGGFAIVDTFLYFISQDTFHAYSIAHPANPYRVGFCRDSGGVAAATGNVAVLRQPGDMLGFIDVSNPAAPRQVGTYPGYTLCADARGNICCAAFYWSTDYDHFRFEVLDISDPTNVRRLGAIDSVGGWDVHLSGPFAFVSGFQTPEWEFTIVDVQDSTHPHVVSSCATPSNNYGVWADWTSDRAYVADCIGLAVIDITNVSAPVLDTVVLKAQTAQDVWPDGSRAYVADYQAGMRVLDVTQPWSPVELGGFDPVGGECETVVAGDSFAFVGWLPSPYFRSILVSDPTHPVQAGAGLVQTLPADMVLRDTLVYLAGRLRFNVVNVARPRQPVLVGSCVTGDLHEAGLWLEGNRAYVAGAYDGIYIVDVTDPRNPAPVRILNGMSAWGCCVVDTFLYVPDFDDSLHIWSVANLFNVYQLGSAYVRGSGLDVKVLGDYAYVGCDGLGVVNVADPRNPVLVECYQTPDFVRRVVIDSGYVYAACWGAGICIFDTFTTSVRDVATTPQSSWPVRLMGSVTRGIATIEFPGFTEREVHLQVLDIAGNKLGWADALAANRGAFARRRVDLTEQPAGVYFVRVGIGDRVYHLRITKL